MKARYIQDMKWYAKGGLLLLLFSMAWLPAGVAQEKHGGSSRSYRAVREAPASTAKPLTLDEGLAILNAALDSRHHAGFNSDCSHFVHGLYENAGFPYEYAPSSDLYEGIDEFRRVSKPQPGDLAVWPGHTGIVVNPAQRSFFSLLSTGAGVDSYDSPYWRQRGRPRFFRYVKATPSGARSASLRTASLNPGVEETEPEDPEESSENVSVSRPAAGRMNTISGAAVVLSPVVHSAHPKPEQVGAAFVQACADSEDTLRVQDFFRPAQPLIVFDHFSVSAMHTSGNEGWADVQIDEVLFFVEGKAEVRKGVERQRWPLSRRDKTSWELTVPRGAIYVPQSIAVRVLSDQLARIKEARSNGAAGPQQKAELARVLDSLLR
jgi:hypothetical protein